MRAWLPWIAMVLAAAVAATSLRNSFAYDDLLVIVDNARVTTLSPPWVYLGQSYWPGGGLYRPLTVWLLAIEWHLAGGAPWLFHAVNIGLHASVTGLVYLLARRTLTPAWAGLAAMLFAVHPVHVEAVANVVGMSEPLCTGLVLASVLLALRGMTNGFTPSLRLGVIGLGMLAALSKEQGFVTPALLLVAAGLLGQPPGASSVRRVAPVAGALVVLLLALMLPRAAVLGGFTGHDPVAPLQGLTPWARALVSLGTVPEWVRLLFWPATLSFDYSPPGFLVASTVGAIHLLAALVLVACFSLAWACRERAPAMTLGIAWAAIAVLPVSNLLLPTGVLLAERTLYLASVGAVLTIAGVGELAWRRWPSGAIRQVVVAAMVAAVLAGAGRSAGRAAIWRDNDALFSQAGVEATNSYRAHRLRATHLDRQGRLEEAEREYRRSIALWGHDPKAYEDLAILLQRQARDAEAATVLRAGLEVAPAAPVMRSKLYHIEARRDDWRRARGTAAVGVSLGDTMFAQLVRRADSALAASELSSLSAGR
jgi:hypothetical protein